MPVATEEPYIEILAWFIMTVVLPAGIAAAPALAMVEGLKLIVKWVFLLPFRGSNYLIETVLSYKDLAVLYLISKIQDSLE